jgi:hypothetical protein
VRLVSAPAGRELPADETVYVVLAMLIRLGVQIQAEDREGGRRKVDQPLEFVLQQRCHAHSSQAEMFSDILPGVPWSIGEKDHCGTIL